MADDILETPEQDDALMQDLGILANLGPINPSEFLEIDTQTSEQKELTRRGTLTRGERNLEDAATAREEGRDVDILDQNLLDAEASGNSEDILEATQARLRFAELNKAVDAQAEGEQLAQRAIFREQQASRQSQIDAQVQGQAAQGQLGNTAAQFGFGSSSALQGVSASVNTQAAAGIGTLSQERQFLADDSTRLGESLTENIAFLNQTFDLGGDINSAQQSILQSQANDAARQAERNNLIGGITAGASIGGAVGGPVGAAVGAGVGVLAAVFDF